MRAISASQPTKNSGGRDVVVQEDAPAAVLARAAVSGEGSA